MKAILRQISNVIGYWIIINETIAAAKLTIFRRESEVLLEGSSIGPLVEGDARGL